MKTEELIELGINEEVAAKILAINGKDIENAKKKLSADKDKEIGALTTARDGIQAQLDTANATLKKFEGLDPEKIQGELQTYKKQAEDAEKKFTREITQRDQRDWLHAKLDEYGVKSPLARKQIISEVMSEETGLRWKPAEGKTPCSFYGFDDYMKAAKAEDDALYQTPEEKAAAEKQAELQKKAPTFTGPTGDPAPGSSGVKYTPPKIF